MAGPFPASSPPLLRRGVGSRIRNHRSPQRQIEGQSARVGAGTWTTSGVVWLAANIPTRRLTYTISVEPRSGTVEVSRAIGRSLEQGRSSKEK